MKRSDVINLYNAYQRLEFIENASNYPVKKSTLTINNNLTYDLTEAECKELISKYRERAIETIKKLGGEL